MLVPTPPAADQRVPAFWRALGLSGLIDVHVHFLPPRMLRRVWAYFDRVGPLTDDRSVAVRPRRDVSMDLCHPRCALDRSILHPAAGKADVLRRTPME